jgi:hypothetical protein
LSKFGNALSLAPPDGLGALVSANLPGIERDTQRSTSAADIGEWVHGDRTACADRGWPGGIQRGSTCKYLPDGGALAVELAGAADALPREALLRPFQSRSSFHACLLSTALSVAVSLNASCGDSGEDAPSTSRNNAGSVGTDASTARDAGTDAGSAPNVDAALPAPVGDGGTPGKTFDGGSEPNRNSVMASGLCDRFATLQCAAEQSCCSNPGRAFDACKTAQLAVCRDQGHLDEAAAVSVSGFDSAKEKSAFERYEALARVCDPSVPAWVLAVQSGFRGVFNGTLDANASCLPPLDAASDLGKAAGYGLACKSPDTTSCLPKSLFEWTCDARGGAGSPCFTDANCAGETYCTNTDASLSGIGKGTCAARKAVGEACTGTGECQSLVCVAKKCAPRSADGAYCLGR